jgi:hypothetical protein
MRKFFNWGVAVTAAMLASFPVFSGDTAQRYQLNVQMKDGGEIVGNPRLEIEGGKEARIEIGRRDGATYSVSFTAHPHTATTASINSIIAIRSAEGNKRLVEPKLLVGFGTPSKVAFGDAGKNESLFEMSFTLNKVGG